MIDGQDEKTRVTNTLIVWYNIHIISNCLRSAISVSTRRGELTLLKNYKIETSFLVQFKKP